MDKKGATQTAIKQASRSEGAADARNRTAEHQTSGAMGHQRKASKCIQKFAQPVESSFRFRAWGWAAAAKIHGAFIHAQTP